MVFDDIVDGNDNTVVFMSCITKITEDDYALREQVPSRAIL